MTILLGIGMGLYAVQSGDKPADTKNAADWIAFLNQGNIAETALNFSGFFFSPFSFSF